MFKKIAVILGFFVCPEMFAISPSRYDFCAYKENPGTPDTTKQDFFWNAPSVQFFTRFAALNPRIVNTPLAAYPTAYVRMTEVRDQERCGGSLSIADRESRMIGDLLANLMSRWLVSTSISCEFRNATGPDYGLCGSMRRVFKNQLKSLESAMDMTAVYLSSHMASSLIAIIYDDQFWREEFPKDTHCVSSPCPKRVIAQRILWIKRYKAGYDLNNRFLAKNLSTVINTLKDACYIRGSLASTGVKLLERLPLEALFGKIRDQTFSAAIEGHSEIDPKKHPMLTQDSQGYTSQYDYFREWTTMPAQLQKAENNARSLIANSLILTATSLAGTRGFDDLAQDPPSLKPDSCPFFK